MIIDFIFNIINSCLKMLFHKLRTQENNVNNDITNEKRPPWFVLSYVPLMSEKFFTIMKNINIKLFFFLKA